MSFYTSKKILDKNKCDFIFLDSSTSTMEDIKIYLENKNKNLILIADNQSKGRGRRGNTWISPKGNLYCSIALKNTIPLNEYFFFSILTSVSIKMALEKLGASEIKFKWPNDIFFKNEKLGGIIIESYKIKILESSNNKIDLVEIKLIEED